MRAVAANAGPQIAPYGPGRGFGGIGGAHGVAPAGNGAVAFEHKHHDFSRTHERCEFAEKSAVAMHGVEALGFRLGQAQGFDGGNCKTSLVNACKNFSGQAAAYGVRFDDSEGAFDDQAILPGPEGQRAFDRETQQTSKNKGQCPNSTQR